MCDDMKSVAVDDNDVKEKVSFTLDSCQSHLTGHFASQPHNEEEMMEQDGDNFQFLLPDNKAESVNKLNVPKNPFGLSQKFDSDTVTAPSTEMSMIRELWNGSLVENVGQSCTDNDLANQEDLSYFKLTPSADIMPSSNEAGSKITIYTDEEDLKFDPNSVYDHDDKENL